MSNEWGSCSTCGEELYYDLCPVCQGLGEGDDEGRRCGECAGRGEVLFCSCYREALALEAEQP